MNQLTPGEAISPPEALTWKMTLQATVRPYDPVTYQALKN